MLYEVKPILLPCKVTLADPVEEAAFALLPMLSVPSSIDGISVTLPALSPAVTDTRRDPLTPWLVEHRTEVSDSHSVDSHPL